MKAFLYSQDSSYAFPLGPKVTTIGRENCDISISSPNIDSQHALIEYDDEQRCFVLKDLNSSSGTYVHDCRVQNTTVRLADRDIIRFGFNGLPLEFRVEHQQQQLSQPETTMPSIYPRQTTTGPLHVITQTIPSRRITNGNNNNQHQIDAQQNNMLCQSRSRAVSAGAQKASGIVLNNQISNNTRDALIRPNAWTFTTTSNAGRTFINGSFTGELDLPNQDNTDITNRVGHLEREVKGREAEIRELTDKLRSIEPLSATFKVEVTTLRSELDKVRREKQAASGFVSSLQRDLHSKESSIAKLNREIDGLKNDSREKDLRLQSLQSKLNLIRDRSRAEEDRNSKEKENRIKSAEQQISELNEHLTRLKAQLQETEKQLLKVNQSEQKLKQEYEHTRGQLAEIQRAEATLKMDLANVQRKHNELCVNIWRCLTNDDSSDEYDENQQDIIEQIQQLLQQLDQARNDLTSQRETYSTLNEQLKTSFGTLTDLLINVMQEQTTASILLQSRQQILEFEQTDDSNDNGSLISMLKRAVTDAVNSHIKLIADLNSLVIKQNDEEQDLSINEILTIIRRQYEDLEVEKRNLLAEKTSDEQRLRDELERIAAEKDTTWQQRLNDECNRLREQIASSQRERNEQSRSFSDRIEQLETENSDYHQRLNQLQVYSTEQINELTRQVQEYKQQLIEQGGPTFVTDLCLPTENERQKELENTNEKQQENSLELIKNRDATIEDLNGQIKVYQEQVRQFSMTIVHLEKQAAEEQEKRIRLQADLDNINKNTEARTSSPTAVEAVVPVVAVPIVDLSQELFAYKARVQEQEQIIFSLRRDLSGMTARLSDLQGELSEKQKQALEKSELTIREQNKELNETRLKLSKLSDIVDQQSTQMQALQTDLSKSSVLVNQYQLLVEQRQAEIERLTKSLDEKNLLVQQVEKSNHDEGRITQELVAIGAQCKGERHEQTIGRQREAVNELRARIKSLEQLRPANPSYEKVLQQVVLLKRELAELRARQALPNDIPYLTVASAPTSATQQQSQAQSTATLRQSPSSSSPSEHAIEQQKLIEEKAAHTETMNSLQACDELLSTFLQKLLALLDVDNDSVNATPLGSLLPADRYVALQQRQRTTEIVAQRLEMLRERLARKEELLRDYEKDLSKLRQAEILLREKDAVLQNLETDKRTKDDEALFLRNTLRETQENLNQEKRINSSIKIGRNSDQLQSNELIRRSGGTGTLHHHCPPDSASYVRTVKYDMNQKLSRKDYEIKTLKQELHEALNTISEQAHRVKLLELQSASTATHGDSNNLTTHNS